MHLFFYTIRVLNPPFSSIVVVVMGTVEPVRIQKSVSNIHSTKESKLFDWYDIVAKYVIKQVYLCVMVFESGILCGFLVLSLLCLPLEMTIN